MLQLHGKPSTLKIFVHGSILAYFLCHSLNYQHYLWQNAAGFKLHPDIPQLHPNAQVADIATGSGYLGHLSIDVLLSCSWSVAEADLVRSLEYGSSISHLPFLLQ